MPAAYVDRLIKFASIAATERPLNNQTAQAFPPTLTVTAHALGDEAQTVTGLIHCSDMHTLLSAAMARPLDPPSAKLSSPHEVVDALFLVGATLVPEIHDVG